jgi:hypothetical protein
MFEKTYVTIWKYSKKPQSTRPYEEKGTKKVDKETTSIKKVEK